MSVHGPSFVFPSCWQCHAKVEDWFCAACAVLQPIPNGINFFTLFQLPHKLNLDEARLTSTFYELSRKWHPDFFYQKSEQEQKISLENTALLNKAYRTLKDPIQRTAYLVMLVEDMPVSTEPPADLFEDIFTLQESLEGVKNTPGDETLVHALTAQQDNFRKRYNEEEEALRHCCDQWDRLYEQQGDVWAEDQKQCVRDMRALLSRRAYFERALGDLAQALHEVSNQANVANVHDRRD